MMREICDEARKRFHGTTWPGILGARLVATILVRQVISDEEKFVSMCRDKDVQELTWQSYTTKKTSAATKSRPLSRRRQGFAAANGFRWLLMRALEQLITSGTFFDWCAYRHSRRSAATDYLEPV